MDRLKWIERCAMRDAFRILDLESEELQMWAQGLTDGPRYAQVQGQLQILREGPVTQPMLEQARRQRLQRRYGRLPYQPAARPIGYHHWKADGTVVVHDPFEHPTTWAPSSSISDLPPLP